MCVFKNEELKQITIIPTFLNESPQSGTYELFYLYEQCSFIELLLSLLFISGFPC